MVYTHYMLKCLYNDYDDSLSTIIMACTCKYSIAVLNIMKNGWDYDILVLLRCVTNVCTSIFTHWDDITRETKWIAMVSKATPPM